MNAYKTPAQAAAIFGCTPAQARAQMVSNLADLRGMLAKATASKTGVFRGFTVAALAERVAALEAAL